MHINNASFLDAKMLQKLYSIKTIKREDLIQKTWYKKISIDIKNSNVTTVVKKLVATILHFWNCRFHLCFSLDTNLQDIMLKHCKKVNNILHEPSE